MVSKNNKNLIYYLEAVKITTKKCVHKEWKKKIKKEKCYTFFSFSFFFGLNSLS